MTALAPGFGRDTSLMAFGTVLSRATGFARTVLVVVALGARDLGDTYALANTIPNIIYDLIIGGVLSATLVPVFARHFAKDDEEDAWAATSAVFTVVLVAITVLTIAVMITAPVIIDFYTLLDNTTSAQEQRDTATFLLRWFAPQIAVYGFVSIATALLHTKRRFAPPMFAPILNNLIVIAMLLSLPLIADDVTLAGIRSNGWALTFLGFGTTFGVIAMGAVLVPYIRHCSRGRLRLVSNFRHPAVGSVLRMSGWTIGFVIANQIAFWVTMLLAGKQSGGIVAFTLAYQLFLLPHGVLSVSIMSALQPELADKWARSAIGEFKTTMSLGLRILLLVVVPIGLLMAVLSTPIIEIIFEFADVTPEQEADIADLVAAMTIGLAGFSCFLFLTRVLQAMHSARAVFYLYVFQNMLAIALAIPLFHAIGLAGLGLANSIAYSAAACAAFLGVRRRVGAIGGRAMFFSLLRIASASAIMTVLAVVVAHETTDFNAAFQLLISGGVGIVALIGLLRVIAPRELDLIMGLRRSDTRNDNK